MTLFIFVILFLFPLMLRHSYQWWKDYLNICRPQYCKKTTYARGEYIIILYCMIFAQFTWLAISGKCLMNWNFLIGVFFVWLGAILGFVAVYSLRNEYSFDICVREGFKLNTKGIYRCVRHPMRLGLALESLGMVILSTQIWTILPWCFILLLQITRTKEEENFLREQTDDYYIYANQVPKWNLIFGVTKLLFHQFVNCPFESKIKIIPRTKIDD